MLWLTPQWLIMVSTTSPWPSISVIAEMEAEEIKHSEQVGCVEAELTCWVVDLKTELCSRILNNSLKEREMRHRMVLLKYLKQVVLFRLRPLLLGELFLFLYPPHVLLQLIAHYLLPIELSTCHLRHAGVVHSLGHRNSLKKAAGVGTMIQNSFRVCL